MKLRILRWEIVLDYPGGPSVTTRVLMRGRQGGGVKVRGRDVTMEAKVREEKRCHTDGFEGEGRGYGTRSAGTLRSWERSGNRFSPGPPDGRSPAHSVMLAP